MMTPCLVTPSGLEAPDPPSYPRRLQVNRGHEAQLLAVRSQRGCLPPPARRRLPLPARGSATAGVTAPSLCFPTSLPGRALFAPAAIHIFKSKIFIHFMLSSFFFCLLKIVLQVLASLDIKITIVHNAGDGSDHPQARVLPQFPCLVFSLSPKKQNKTKQTNRKQPLPRENPLSHQACHVQGEHGQGIPTPCHRAQWLPQTWAVAPGGCWVGQASPLHGQVSRGPAVTLSAPPPTVGPLDRDVLPRESGECVHVGGPVLAPLS